MLVKLTCCGGFLRADGVWTPLWLLGLGEFVSKTNIGLVGAYDALGEYGRLWRSASLHALY